MKTAIISAILTYLIFTIWPSNNVSYSIGIFGLILSACIVYLLRIVRVPLIEGDYPEVKKFSLKLNTDKNLSQYISEIYLVGILQILTLIFLVEEFMLLFLGIGLIIVTLRTLEYTRNTYYDDIREIIEIINEEDLE